MRTLKDIALDLLDKYETDESIYRTDCFTYDPEQAKQELAKECDAIKKEILQASRRLRPVVPCEDCEYNRFCSQYIDIHGKYYHIDYCSGSEHSGAVKK